jgi:hypothetical protein
MFELLLETEGRVTEHTKYAINHTIQMLCPWCEAQGYTRHGEDDMKRAAAYEPDLKRGCHCRQNFF